MAKEIGTWFLIEFGYEVVPAQCVGHAPNGDYLMSLHWGNPWRNMHRVDRRDVMMPIEDPRWFKRLARMFSTPPADKQREER